MNLQAALEQRAKVEEFQRRHRIGLLTLLFTDLVGSTKLKQELGDRTAVALIQRHHVLVRELLGRFKEGEEIGTAGDSFFIVFTRPSDAVQFSLLLQNRLRALGQETSRPLRDRVGIHIGEVMVEERSDSAKHIDLYGLQVDISARVMSLAEGDQILMTRSAFDNARQVLKGQDIPGIQELSWLNHGPYVLKGVEEPLEICEVGEVGEAVLKPAPDSEKVHRYVSVDAEPVLGWRPAIGQLVPNTQWLLEEKLGEGGFGEVWLGRRPTDKQRRVFKFCFRADRVRSLKREMTLFRLLKERLGQHPKTVAIYDVHFDQAPYYLEMEYVLGRDLRTWSEKRGGVKAIPLEERLEIVAQVADALQAAHDAGVVHRDVKPSNILISQPSTPNSQLTAKLTDFGIGQVISEEILAGLTRAGFTETVATASSSSGAGTYLYLAPELVAGQRASIRSDIYSLGVLLYQVLVGDLSRPITTDWEEKITDPILAEDLKQCLAGEPDRRFKRAGQLAENLRSLEKRRSVLAQQQGALPEGERAAIRPWMFRKVGWAAAVVLIVLISAGEITWQSIRAIRTEREAQAEASRSRQTASFLDDMVRSIQASVALGADPAKLRGILDTAAERAGQEFQNHPRGEAEIRTALGRAYRELGDHAKAEANFRTALALTKKHLGNEHPNVATLQSHLAGVLQAQGKVPAVEPRQRDGLATAQPRAAQMPTSASGLTGAPLVDDRVRVPPITGAQPEEGFNSLFNGKDLTGWEGRPEHWSVQDGAITGRTTKEQPAIAETYLIWRPNGQNGEVSDFELRLSYRIVHYNDRGFANAGIQYRSKDFVNFVVGYQAEIYSGPVYSSGMLCESHMDGILAQRGHKTIVKTVDGKTKVDVIGSVGNSDEILAAINREDWNEYVIIAKGNHFQHFINGKQTVDVTDEREGKGAKSGILALQLQAPLPMTIQFKNIRIKSLKALRSKASDVTAQQPAGLTADEVLPRKIPPETSPQLRPQAPQVLRTTAQPPPSRTEAHPETIPLAPTEGFAGGTADKLTPQSVPQLQELVSRIKGKLTEGKNTEKDLADDLKQFDVLLEDHKGEKTDDVAEILFMKAMLYLQVLDNADKALELIKQLKTRFPNTNRGRGADGLIASIQKQENAKKIQKALVVGAEFPDFEESDLVGKAMSLANYRGKVVLVDFWATWCGPCVGELPNVLTTYEKYHNKGFEIIGINLDQDEQALRNFILRRGVSWQQFFDGKGWNNKLAEKYGIQSIPATFLLDGEGRIVAKDLRGEALVREVEKILNRVAIPSAVPASEEPREELRNVVMPKQDSRADAPATFEVGEFKFTRPSTWEWVELPSTMRKAQLNVVDDKTKSSAEVVFYSNIGDGIMANVERWFGLFREPRENINAKTEQIIVGKQKVIYASAQGTYLSSVPGRARTPMRDHSLLGAILPSPTSDVYIRMTGPSELVKRSTQDFKKMVEGALK